MNRKYEHEDGLDLEATVRDLRALEVESTGELAWRQSVGRSFEKTRREIEQAKTRLVHLEEKQVGRTEVATIAQKELAVVETKVATLERIVWGLTGALGVAIIGIAAAKVFK